VRATSLRRDPARRGERGLGVVIVAVLAVLLLGFVGLAVDGAHMQAAAQELQDVADAAALAAAHRLALEAPTGGDGGAFPATRQAAIAVAAANRAAGASLELDANVANEGTGDIVVGRWERESGTFTPTTSDPDAVQVVARRTQDSGSGPLTLLFGGLFGAAQGQVARRSVATTVTTAPARVHALDAGAQGALTLSGNALLDVGSGRVQVDSRHACALKFNGKPQLLAGSVNVHGGACAPAGSIGGTLTEWGAALGDPLSGILPATADWNALKGGLPKPLGSNGKVSASGTFDPGYYPKGLSITSSSKVTLRPGTYLFGAGFTLAGQSRVAGSGVTILLDSGVKVSVTGGATLDLAPPDSGAFEGLTMMFHRGTSASNACSIGGTGAFSFRGTLYCPSGTVSFGGTSDSQSFGQVVCARFTAAGTPDITGDSIVPPPGTGRAMLVD